MVISKSVIDFKKWYFGLVTSREEDEFKNLDEWLSESPTNHPPQK